MNGVYCLTNIINGKRYVGRAVNKKGNGIEVRWGQYKCLANCVKPQKLLYAALKKYGVDNFKFEVVLETSDSDNANRSEMYLIDVWDLQNIDKGYNMQPGGGCGNYGLPSKKKGIQVSEETRKRMSLSKIGIGLGRKHTDEAKEKNRLKHIGRGIKMKTLTCKICSKQWQVNGSSLQRNKKTCSDECYNILMREHFKKLSLLKKGVKRSKETIEKMVKSRVGKYKGKDNPNYGKKHSDETKKKISDTKKKLFEDGIIVGKWYPRKSNKEIV